MKNQLVECVPNFSNGRHPAVYQAIANAIKQISSVHILGISADADHNRTVITFVGTPDTVAEAAFRAIAKAAELINLDEHTGEHPRIGATDVCPLIPLKNVNQEECVALARRLGQRVGEELGIAVYLYGAAATRPERERLSDIRRGEYEQWQAEIGQNPARDPDFGPAEPKPWGATVIGVRPFLIAYNLFLNTDDATVARKIARTIRHSSGGLRHVQAKGFLVDGQAQVSMNLTDYEKTPIPVVQEMVKREAARYGVVVTRAELIGLTPQQALTDTAKYYLQLDDLRGEQILEHQLQDIQKADVRPIAFLEATAAATPTPGGGAVAALAGALGAALAQMVAGLTAGRKKYADVDAEARKVLAQAESLQRTLTAAMDEDVAAFQGLMAAWRDKSLAGEERTAVIEEAKRHAAAVPLQVAKLSRDVAKLAETIATIGNVNAATDAAAAAVMARAAVQIAALNVKTNLATLNDQALAQRWRAQANELVAETTTLATAAATVAAERGGFNQS